MIRNLIFIVVLTMVIFSCKSQSSKLSLSESNDFIQSFRSEAVTHLSDGAYYPQLKRNGFGALYYYSYITEQKDKNSAMPYLLAELHSLSAFSERAAIRYALLAFNGAKFDPLFARHLDQMLLMRQYKNSSALLFARATIFFLQKNFSSADRLLNNIDTDRINYYSIANEVDALRALTAKGVGDANSRLLLDGFFLNRKTTPLTTIAFKHLNSITRMNDSSSYDLYKAMDLKQQGLTQQAFKVANSYLNGGDDLSFLNNNEHFFTQYANLAERSGHRSLASMTLETKLNVFIDQSYATAALAIAKLNRSMGINNYDKALAYIERSLTSSLSKSDFDRALWYHLDISKNIYLKNNSGSYFSDLEEFAPLWYRQAYFNDILESTLAILVQKRDFKSIYRLYYSVVKPFADRVSIADYAWVLSQALEHGIELGSNTPQMSSLEKKRNNQALHQSLMDDTLVDPSSYAAFMHAAVTRKLPKPLSTMSRVTKDSRFHIDGREQSVKIVPEDLASSAFKVFRSMAGGKEPISNDLHLLGFFYYATMKDAKILAMVNAKIEQQLPLFSTDLIRLIARQYNLEGNYLKAIRVMHRIKWRHDFNPNFFDYQIMYPKVFSDEVEMAAKKYSLNHHIFYGLIRQESGFTASIVSSAQAVGLAQIMPASADEFSRQLGMEFYDLTDPSTNLIFGAYYLNWMNRRQNDGMYSVLMGYNAGPTRARRWIRDWIDLSSAIAVEAIPYHETRNYIKNIVVSSAIYGYIYDGVEPYVTIGEIFPESLKSYNDFMATE